MSFCFSGRASRKQFFIYFVFCSIIQGELPIAAILGLSITENAHTVFIFLSVFLVIITAIPMPALIVRRLHDRDISGWWAIVIVPLFFGSYFFLISMFFIVLWGLVFSILFFIAAMVIAVFFCAIFKKETCDLSLNGLWADMLDKIPLEFWALPTLSCVGFLATTVFLSLKGTQGDNRYGLALETNICQDD